MSPSPPVSVDELVERELGELRVRLLDLGDLRVVGVGVEGDDRDVRRERLVDARGQGLGLAVVDDDAP